MTTNIVLSTIFGVLGIGACIIIYQQNQKEKLLTWKLVSDVLWALHYFFLSAYSGTAVAIIAIFREIAFYGQAKKNTKSKGLLIFFVCISLTSAFVTWNGFLSVLPAIGSVMSITSFWYGNPKVTRYISFPTSALMLTYDVFCHSYIGIFNEIFTICSSVVGVLRYRKK